jgi:hypothetical protein
MYKYFIKLFFCAHVLFHCSIFILNGWFLCEFHEKGLFKYQKNTNMFCLVR